MLTRISYFVKFPVKTFSFELKPKMLSVYDRQTYGRTGTVTYKNSFTVKNHFYIPVLRGPHVSSVWFGSRERAKFDQLK